VAPGFSPLDEVLGWLPGSLSPTVQEGMILVGAQVPFRQAAALIAHFTHVTVSAATVTRVTEAAGAVLVAVETARVEELERDLPASPAGPPILQISIDGAMVPTRAGWHEVKTLVAGVVVKLGTGEAGGRATDLSYCARMTDVTAFARAALGELHRRGLERAGVVVGVVDGAAWCQSFLDYHTPDAVRILDFPHALEHLSAAAQAVFGAGSAEASDWLGRQAHALRHGDPTVVLQALTDLPVDQARDPEAADKARAAELAYCTTRIAQMQYRAFAAQGYPIGSGAVESANKLVVEARLKGAGMHWAVANVDPLLALRCAICSGTWCSAWTALSDERMRRARRRHPRPQPAPVPTVRGEPPDPPVARVVVPAPHTKTIVNGRPTANHPWKRTFRPVAPATIPKT